MTTAANLREELDRPYSLTAEQIERYREQGFIKLKHVLSPEVLEYYGDAVTRLVHELNKNPKPLHERDTYGKAFMPGLEVGDLCDTEMTPVLYP